MERVLEKFLRYIKIDTQSDEKSKTTPSTKKQFNLAELLVNELKDLGLENISLDNSGYIMAELKSNIEKDVPKIGFISHMDTSPDMSGENVNAQVINNYNGKDIVLNKKENIILSINDFPELQNYTGKTLVTTDGTTLLGADDKAGIAEIMTAVEYLVNNPEIKHGSVKIGFTPDEEIGRGVDKFDVKKFGADYAYTIDGGLIGELEYECFNACNVNIFIQGKNIHPGYAKDKMKNSVMIANELDRMLPVNQRPEFTEKYEGFFHLNNIYGNVEKTEIVYIIRDHNREKFENKKDLLKKAVKYLNKKYGMNTVKLKMNDVYYNMREKIEKDMRVVNIAEKAMIKTGVTPVIKPIRGGTDGSRLSYMGLLTPNIFTGGHNPHGKHEFICVESMIKSVEVILKIIELYGLG